MINIIVAYCRNRGIGINNTLPWHLPEDLKRFKFLTEGSNNTVIMGRKTWESLPLKPLPKRNNIIITTTMDKEINYKNTVVYRNLLDALDYTKEKEIKNTWIIGGAKIYEEALKKNIVNNIYATEIDASFICNTFFPNISESFVKNSASNWYTYNIVDYRYFHYINTSIKK